MTLNKKCLLIVITFFLSGWAVAQNDQQHWSDMMSDPNANFYEIQDSFETYWESHEIEKGKGFKQFKRWEWFMEPRVYPSGEKLKVDASWEAVEDERRLGSNSERSAAGMWSYYGNTDIPTSGGGVGRINNVRPDPVTANTYYACAPGGGLWKTINAGGSWSLMNTDDLASIGVTDIAIDPTDTDVMYIATGDGDAGDTYALGVLKSVDGGLTWNATGLNWAVTQTRRTSRILMHPSNNNMLIVATSNGIYKSTDGATSWTQEQSGNFKDLKWHPTDNTILYAAGNGDDFYRSTDTGDSWTQVTNGLPTSGVSRMSLAVSANSADVVYIVAGNSADQGFYGFYRSTDAGLTFTQQSSTPNLLGWATDGSDSGGQAWYDLAIDADPNDANTIYVGGVNIWKSVDGGVNWSLNAHWYGGGGVPYAHADNHGFNFIPGTSTLLVGSDGGVYTTSDGGSNWADISSNLEVAQMYRLGVSQTATDKVITGWQDNGTNLKDGANWSRVIGGDGFESIIDYTDENIMYGALYYGNIRKSTGGGFTTILNSGGTAENSNGAWLTPYILDPTNPNTIYVGKNTVYKSVDGGGSWSGLGAIAGGNMNGLAVAKSNSNYIYCSKGADLYASTDGTNFSALSGYPNQYITYIAIDPADENRIWITLSGYTSNEKVSFSDDGGATWTNFSDGLPNIPANCIAYMEGSNDGLYVGTDAGVYYRDGSFGAWQPYKDGMPNVVVTEVEIQYSSNSIIASTYGRGLWKAPLFVLPAEDVGVISVTAPEGSYCETDVIPEFSFGNFGADPITSVDFNYGNQGGTVYTYNWTGNLLTGETALIALPVFDEGPGTFTFEVSVSDVNGNGADGNLLNDSGTTEFTAYSAAVSWTLNILTDNYPAETSWNIIDTDNGNVEVASGSGYTGTQTNYVETGCLPLGCYQLNFYDTFGDGMQYQGVVGSYTLEDTDGNILAEIVAGGNFLFEANHPFCLVNTDPNGCTNPVACNYDALATVDDGSCILPDGCTDSNACNYNAAALCDDGSCILPDGCTNSTACNYNAAAVCDDGSCALPDGCTNNTACNYNAAALCDDGSCILPDGCTNNTACNYNAAALCDDGSCILPDGCTNNVACNYNAAATCDDGSCILPDGCTNNTACNYNAAALCDDGSCILPDGCTDSNACNYNPAAVCDDGSCTLPDGCTNNTACNYNAAALCDDGSCILPDGCTNNTACNYNAAAVCDDGSCILPDGCTDNAACNYNAAAVCDDGSCTLPDGCTNNTACNYNATALCDDGTCILPNGCTNNSACNFDPLATCDDGSCILPDGCTDSNACNYNAAAICDDGSCVLPSTTYYADTDSDGYGDDNVSIVACTQPAGYVIDNTDCDDSRNDVYPGAPGTAEGIDNNCNQMIDPSEETPCMGDINNDGTRDVADLLMLLSGFGCTDNCDADMTGDNLVDAQDILTFLGVFGQLCP